MRNQLLLWRHQQDHTLYSLQDGRTGIRRSADASPTARDPETCLQAALPAPVTCLQVTCLQAAVTCLQAAPPAPATSSSLYGYAGTLDYTDACACGHLDGSAARRELDASAPRHPPLLQTYSTLAYMPRLFDIPNSLPRCIPPPHAPMS